MGNLVAIVGRPNVGKSTLFNRLTKTRQAIVNEEAGTTRDRQYGKSEWLGREFSVVDTGGWVVNSDDVFEEEIRKQVLLAVEEADVILFVVDVMNGVTDLDMQVAAILRRANSPVIMVANKTDNHDLQYNAPEFYKLGLGDPYCVSAMTGSGTGDLMDLIVSNFKKESSEILDDDIPRFAVVGRPNAGKSSIVNAILREDRSIVSNIQGTTRDAIDTPFRCNGKPYVIVDTAGIRKRGRVYESVEKYSVLRAMSAIEKCDVALFLIDGEKGIREQDKHVAGYAYEAGKPMIIVVNKWDAVEKDEHTMVEFEEKVRNEFAYLSYAPILFVSAKTRQRVDTIIPEVDRVYENSTRRVPTNILNEVIADSQITTPAPARNGKRFRIYYATQVAIQPPTFVLSCNEPKLMHFTYQRFIENTLRRAFDFEGTPIHIISRKKVSE